MGKRGPKKGHGGRPRGSGIGKYRGGPAKYPEEIREFWRQIYYLRKDLLFGKGHKKAKEKEVKMYGFSGNEKEDS